MVKAVTYILENDATVQGIVGTRSEGTTTDYKVFPLVVPQSEKEPYVAARLVSQVNLGKDDSCGFSYVIQVVCVHGSYDQMTTLAIAVKNALINQTPGDVNGIAFGYLNQINATDGEFTKEHNLYSRILTFDGTDGS
jgi:hypothetical protein